jgi:hypothetical protein
VLRRWSRKLWNNHPAFPLADIFIFSNWGFGEPWQMKRKRKQRLAQA